MSLAFSRQRCWGSSVTVASAVTTPTAKIDGLYRIESTDCYFAAGKCRARFDIEQSGATLSDPSDKYFHGKVSGDRVKVGERFPKGTSEDGWIARGHDLERREDRERRFLRRYWW